MSDLLDRVLPVTAEDDEWWCQAIAWIDAHPAVAAAGQGTDFRHVIERAIKALAAADKQENESP